MKKYQIEMPDGWKPDDDGDCGNCYKDWPCHKDTGYHAGCPLSHAVEVAPTANADLVGEKVINDLRVLIGTYRDADEQIEGYLWADKVVEDIEEVLSKYRPVPVVKEQGEEGLWEKHIVKEGSHVHVVMYDRIGPKCSEPRCEINQYRSAPAPVASGLVEEMTIYNNTVIRNVDSEMWRQVDSILSRYSKEAK